MSGTDNFETVVKERRAEAVAEFHEDRSLLKRIQHALHVSPALVPMIVLVASIIIFAIAVDGKAMLASLGLLDPMVGAGLLDAPSTAEARYRLFSAGTLTLILQQVQIVGIVAAAQALVILTAGIDLSVGAIMVLSSVVMGQFAFRYGIPVPLAVLCGLGVGSALGAMNGWLVAVMRLPPFIVTLGTWQIILATNYLYSANQTIRAQEISAQAPLLQFFASTIKFGADENGRGGATFTYGVIFMILLILVLSYALRQTAWGRHVYAVGDDPEAAQLSGVNVKRTLISVYMLSGLICAFAGWALIGRIGSVSPTSGAEANIQSITAVVIGGISLFGGRGSIVGALFGALIVGVFELALRLLGADSQWTFFFIGVLIIAAVAVDQWIRKAAA